MPSAPAFPIVEAFPPRHWGVGGENKQGTGKKKKKKKYGRRGYWEEVYENDGSKFFRHTRSGRTRRSDPYI